MDKITVLFNPDNLAVQVEPGTSLLHAANLAGIELVSSCGGDGTCGRCLVKVQDGHVRVKGTGNISSRAKQAGLVLACQTFAEGNVVVDIPGRSRLEEHQVLLDEQQLLVEKDVEGAEGFKLQPLCSKLTLTLTPPTLDENVADWERLQTAVRNEICCSDIRISLSVLKQLPEALRAGDWQVTIGVTQINGCAEVIAVESGHAKTSKLYGVAIDIGTTTVAAHLVDLVSGFTVSKKGTYNKQARFGDDVISRIIHASERPEGLAELHHTIINTINGLLAELLQPGNLAAQDVLMVTVAANTTMTHLFLGIPPKYIRLEPYIPLAAATPAVKAQEVGLNINPEAYVVCFPSVASYVGGDIVSGTLVTNVAKDERITLFIDIGTNGEMVLGNQDWLVSAACSAGPAFEGGGITYGMRAMKGAIDNVEINPDNFEVEVSTIGRCRAKGLCGSGLIDCLATFRNVGIIDRAGKMQTDIQTPRLRQAEEGWEFVLVYGEDSDSGKDIVITENDVKNLLRAKAAVYAGIHSMLNAVELDIGMIERVLIAGGFGNYLNIRDAITIGLLPDLPAEKYMFIGNSSLKGARLALISQEAWHEAQELGDKITYLELSAGNDFMEEFMSALFLPHTDMSLFPSVTNAK
ncbi:MAG TPA: ASKHA domain-containing protein [Oscillospiraceae bacterium]|nr:ASKHA domain-containing protein [Oscillospiraceae bacterium]